MSITKIAKDLGVHPSTVSRALSGKSGVSDKLRKKIIEYAEQIGFYPDARASSLRRKGKTGTLGIVVPDVGNPFYAEAIKSMEDVFYSHNFNFFLCVSDENPDKENFHLKNLISHRVDGIIAAPTLDKKTETFYKKIAELKKPIVFFDRYIPSLDIPYVVTNNKNGIIKLLKYLLKLGHKTLGIVSLSPESITGKIRLESALEFSKKFEIEIKPNWIQGFDSTQESGYLSMKKILQLKNKPSAVLILNDLTTLGALKAIKEMKVKIPNDISIVSFDDTFWNQIFDPPITCVKQEPKEMGILAAKMLINLLNHKNNLNKRIYLETKLIIRNSVKKLL
ncbi:LacI family DNA-binding transcriptional regulator [Thermosipho atlanticus]|uniref:Transcriptional regulator, LacI family n=1 Tax=Thermosipho atlanticus DSM 15807 TaxID=1123380 RepID=A0A1M5TV82_9BACT|nr:LacI family DNA-binding transcriptional regulator [Thermosipho atlanticus]SHH54687.1 transcriptional regulator, LacI family [Thermosipho atlanticus DSM 15807]